MKEKCTSCLKDTVNQHLILDIPVCMDCCKNNENFQVISKSTAKNEYLLKDKDLKDLQSGTCRNPVYRSAAPMIMYLKSEVASKCKNLYPEPELERERRKKKSDSTKRKREINKKEKMDRNRKVLEKLFNQNGLQVRDDSFLCSNYIDGTLKDWTAKQVLDRMALMHFLHNYTNYKEVHQQVYNEYRNNGNIFYKGEIEDVAIDRVMKNHKNMDHYPWLNGPMDYSL